MSFKVTAPGCGQSLKKKIDDGHYKAVIIEYLKKFKTGQRADFEQILLDKLPEVLDDNQKKSRVKNLLQAMRKVGIIEVSGKTWTMSRKMHN